MDTEGTLTYIRHEPFGVCGGIIPWNVPLIMFAMKAAPALATGNVIVIKPSEIGPLSSIKMAALIKEAGFPPGVVNVVTGYGATAGDALARHPLVRKIAFTGSGAVGRLVMKAAAETNLKKVTLELGGKSPNIFFDDISDLDKAVSWAYKAIYMNAGQICLAGSRIYVQEGIYDKFLEKFKQLVLAAKVGSPWDDGVIQGPQISQRQMERVLEYIDIGKKEGATCLLGGNRHGNQGYFIEPTVFTGKKEEKVSICKLKKISNRCRDLDVSPDMRIMKEEIFGPVAAISKFNDIDEVVKEANDTEYGLAAGVFTSNVKTAIEVSNKLESGAVCEYLQSFTQEAELHAYGYHDVGVNHYLSADVYAPFGGYKQSGIGRENSEYSLQEYYQARKIIIFLHNVYILTWIFHALDQDSQDQPQELAYCCSFNIDDVWQDHCIFIPNPFESRIFPCMDNQKGLRVPLIEMYMVTCYIS